MIAYLVHVNFAEEKTIQTYDPTIEDAYRKQLVVDNRMCFVEVIDTAGQGELVLDPDFRRHSLM